MRAFFRFISVILLIAFVLLFPISLLMRNVGQILFDPETTRTLIEDQIEGDQLARAIEESARALLTSQGQGEEGANALLAKGLDALNDEDWRVITNLIAPRDLILQSSDQVVTAIVDWIDSEEALPQLTLDLAPWKRNVVQNGEAIVVVILDALPQCTLEELGTQLLDGLTGEGDLSGAIPACRPGEPLYSTVIDNSGSFVRAFTERLPAQIELSRLPIDGLDQLTQVKSALAQTRSTLTLPWMFLLALAGLAVALASRNMRDVLLWAGWPSLLAGLGLILLAFSLSSVLSPLLTFIASLISSEAAFASSALVNSLLSILGDGLAQPLYRQGLVAIVIGAAMLISLRFVEPKEGI